MADTKPVILDQYERPVKREVLTQEVAGPTVGGIRTPYSGYPGDGLEPRRLAGILRAADQGDPLRFFELAEQIEERDMHYVGVLGTRKRQVAQLEIFVDAASDKPEDVERADRVRAWLGRDELADELFDILDAIGKGISSTEIIWDTSSGQWQPLRLEWRDPRWFTTDRVDGKTPMLRTESGDRPLDPFKFIIATIRAKSGIPVRSGIARLAAWNWMFKAFTQKDWAIFSQTFGQPVRVGKYPAGASEKDKDTLFRAVANIAGDCAAIIPESMLIEFIESQNVGTGSDLYMKRSDWLDQQTSKCVLGQTATTDAIAGGHAVGQEHRQVQKDIERSDARKLAAVLNRDLIGPWMMLEYGPLEAYPRLRIGADDDDNIEQMIKGAVNLVPMGLRVSESFMRDKLGIPDPAPDEVLLTPPPQAPSPFGFDATGSPALQSRRLGKRSASEVALLAAAAERLAQPAFDELVGEIRTALMSAKSLEDVRKHLGHLRLDEANMADALRLSLVMAKLAGRADIADGIA